MPMIRRKQTNSTTRGQGITSDIQEKLAKVNWQVVGTRLLGVICLMVLGGLLVVGLWPFRPPKNGVKWLKSGSGLNFGWRGTVLSSGKLQPWKVPGDSSYSFEIWFEPRYTEASSTLFALYASGNPRRFALRQSISDLCMQSDLQDGHFRTKSTRLYIDEVFRQGKPLFVTVTSNGGNVSVYLDGVLVRTSSQFPLSSRDLDGELVIGTNSVDDDSWSGLLKGLAFYNHELFPAEVVGHYKTWTEKGRPDISESERAVALYLFNEHVGSVVHNQVPSGADLYIPERYNLVHEAFLEPFWEAFSPTWDYWKDVLVNIAGFVPFGFLVCAYFSLAGRIKRPALLTILLGFAVSLTIESLQSFLPTRDSDSTDVITNTLGTCYGVWLYRLKLW